MSVTSCPYRVNALSVAAAHGRTLSIACLVLLLCAGCGTLVRSASFRERPDATAIGSQLGPFDGRVVDADTGKPIEGAQVFCSWAFVSGVGTHAPETSRTFETTADADGRYVVPKLDDLPTGASIRLDRMTLIVYQRGYVVYRSDVRFTGARPRLDFTQRDNLVELARWSPELSHAQHLMFIGGGTPLEDATKTEVALAAAQLSGTQPMTSLALGGPPLADETQREPTGEAKRLLTSDDVRAVTQYRGPFAGAPLSDPGDAVDTWHLRAVDQSERYDVAVRVWRMAGSFLDKKYVDIREALPDSRVTDQVGDGSFVVEQNSILSLGFIARAVDAIVIISCGPGQCASEALLVALAERVYQNALRLPSLSDLRRIDEAEQTMDLKGF